MLQHFFVFLLLLVVPAPQCVVDSDCRTTEQCHTGNCINACFLDKCGVNAICSARQHQASCTCPPNYTGDPRKACYPSKCVAFKRNFRNVCKCFAKRNSLLLSNVI